jgi:hypothetical protein
VVKSISDIDQTYYPETMGAFLIVNCSIIFPFTWGIVKSFLDPNVAGKIQVIARRKDFEPALCKLIGEDVVPSDYGGKGVQYDPTVHPYVQSIDESPAAVARLYPLLPLRQECQKPITRPFHLSDTDDDGARSEDEVSSHHGSTHAGTASVLSGLSGHSRHSTERKDGLSGLANRRYGCAAMQSWAHNAWIRLGNTFRSTGGIADALSYAIRISLLFAIVAIGLGSYALSDFYWSSGTAETELWAGVLIVLASSFAGIVSIFALFGIHTRNRMSLLFYGSFLVLVQLIFFSLSIVCLLSASESGGSLSRAYDRLADRIDGSQLRRFNLIVGLVSVIAFIFYIPNTLLSWLLWLRLERFSDLTPSKQDIQLRGIVLATQYITLPFLVVMFCYGIWNTDVLIKTRVFHYVEVVYALIYSAGALFVGGLYAIWATRSVYLSIFWFYYAIIQPLTLAAMLYGATICFSSISGVKSMIQELSDEDVLVTRHIPSVQGLNTVEAMTSVVVSMLIVSGCLICFAILLQIFCLIAARRLYYSNYEFAQEGTAQGAGPDNVRQLLKSSMESMDGDLPQRENSTGLKDPRWLNRQIKTVRRAMSLSRVDTFESDNESSGDESDDFGDGNGDDNDHRDSDRSGSSGDKSLYHHLKEGRRKTSLEADSQASSQSTRSFLRNRTRSGQRTGAQSLLMHGAADAQNHDIVRLKWKKRLLNRWEILIITWATLLGLFIIFFSGTFALMSALFYSYGENSLKDLHMMRAWDAIGFLTDRNDYVHDLQISSSSIMALTVGPGLLCYAWQTYTVSNLRHSFGAGCACVLLYSKLLYYIVQVYHYFGEWKFHRPLLVLSFILQLLFQFVMPATLLYYEARQIHQLSVRSNLSQAILSSQNEKSNKNGRTRITWASDTGKPMKRVTSKDRISNIVEQGKRVLFLKPSKNRITRDDEYASSDRNITLIEESYGLDVETPLESDARIVISGNNDQMAAHLSGTDDDYLDDGTTVDGSLKLRRVGGSRPPRLEGFSTPQKPSLAPHGEVTQQSTVGAVGAVGSWLYSVYSQSPLSLNGIFGSTEENEEHTINWKHEEEDFAPV